MSLVADAPEMELNDHPAVTLEISLEIAAGGLWLCRSRIGGNARHPCALE